LIGVRRYRRARQEPFAIANGLVTVVLVLATLPLIATGLNYIPLRITEFTNIFVAPFAATTLLRWSRTDPFRISRFAAPMSPGARVLPKAFALLLCAGIFMGGTLAPVINMREYFEPPAVRTTESPLYLGSDMRRAADWARVYFAKGRIWGDQLSIDTFSGFADMETDFGSTRLFVATSLTKEATALVAVGDYIVVDRYMLLARPNFYHEPALPGPLNRTQTEKFETAPYLALIYQDGTVAIYRVMIPVPP
jgi:hypothetical protein